MAANETVNTGSGTGSDGEAGGAGGFRDRNTWMRGGYMLLFVVAFSLVQSLHTLFAVVQFLALLIFGTPNRYLAEFGASLAEWTRETSRFLTCAADRRPWPFAPWPKAAD
ncbi:MAG: DUF4389 domain-containing protein [Pseudomonadota bacterium]